MMIYVALCLPPLPTYFLACQFDHALAYIVHLILLSCYPMIENIEWQLHQHNKSRSTYVRINDFHSLS